MSAVAQAPVWTQQPPFPVAVDWSHELAAGLVFDYDPDTSSDRTQTYPATNNGPTPVNNVDGVGRTFVRASSQFVDLGTTPWLNFGANDFSLEVIFTEAASGVRYFLLGKDVAASAGNRQLLLELGATNILSLTLFDAAATGISQCVTTMTFAASTRYHVIAQRVGNSMECYVNGVPVTFNTGASHTGWITMASNAISTYLGGRNFATTQQYFDGSITLFRARMGSLKPSQVLALYENPWQIYQAPGMVEGLNSIAASFLPAWASGANASVIGSGIHA